MTTLGNITDCTQNGTCILQGPFPIIFIIWDILDKALVVLTNGATILIVHKHRYAMFEIPSNIFISCLTLGDLVSAVNLPLSMATIFLSPGVGWTVCCVGSLSVLTATSLVNIITLCVIAVDRLIYIIYPLQYHLKVPEQRAWWIVYGIWISAVVYAIVVNIVGYRDASMIGSIARPCSSIFSTQGIARWMLFAPFVLFVPATIGSYIKIGLVALKQNNAVAAEAPGQVQPHPQNNYKITKVMFTVLVLYVLCTIVILLTPTVIMSLEPGPKEIAFKVSGFVWRINTWLNPIIYMWKSQKFRQYVRSFVSGGPSGEGTYIM